MWDSKRCLHWFAQNMNKAMIVRNMQRMRVVSYVSKVWISFRNEIRLIPVDPTRLRVGEVFLWSVEGRELSLTLSPTLSAICNNMQQALHQLWYRCCCIAKHYAVMPWKRFSHCFPLCEENPPGASGLPQQLHKVHHAFISQMVM